MKKIIDGKMYDTEKSVCIGSASNIGRGASSVSDLNCWISNLYLTQNTKEYFIEGKGGPMSMFAHHLDENTISGGNDIILMPKEDAQNWAEKYLDSDIVTKFFEIEDA
jgi:hypothetical protein